MNFEEKRWSRSTSRLVSSSKGIELIKGFDLKTRAASGIGRTVNKNTQLRRTKNLMSAQLFLGEKNGGKTMTEYKIAVVAGDGIGPEVMTECKKVLAAAAELDGGFRFVFTDFPWGCQYYLKTDR